MQHAPPVLDYGRRGDHYPARGGRAALGGVGRAIGVLMAVPLVPLLWVMLGVPPMPFSPLFRVLSGKVFADRVVAYEANVFGTLTPFVVRDYFWYFAVVAVPALLYVAVVRVVGGGGAGEGGRGFAVAAAGVCACLLVLLTVPFVWLVQYTRSMGVTAARVSGLACGVGAYVVIVSVGWWCVRGRAPR